MHELDVFFPPEGEAGMEESEEIEEKEKWKRLKSMLRETKRFEMGAGGWGFLSSEFTSRMEGIEGMEKREETEEKGKWRKLK